MEEYIVCIGGANIDKKAFCDPIILGTSNSVNLKKSFGGVARNVAENLAHLDIPVKLISFTGNDAEGRAVIENCSKNKIDTTHTIVMEGYNTGTYTAILDHSGELQFALNDMNIYNEIKWEMIENHWHIIKKARYVFAETNLPAEIIKNLIFRAKEDKISLIIDPVSVEKSLKLPVDLKGVFLVTPNRYEAKIITNTILETENDLQTASENLFNKGLTHAMIKLGDKGIFYKNSDTKEQFFLPPYRTSVRDVTGAGDSMIAGILYGLYKGTDLKKAVEYGLKAASITVRSQETVSEQMNINNIENFESIVWKD